jgi:hypothetical protein
MPDLGPRGPWIQVQQPVAAILKRHNIARKKTSRGDILSNYRAATAAQLELAVSVDNAGKG